MHPSVVADAGGLLVLSGLLEGIEHPVDEVLVLDSTTLLLAEYLAVRHEGAADVARAAFALAVRVVQEWFPVRALAIEVSLAAGPDRDIDGCASLALAESLRVPLVTKNRLLESQSVAVLYC